MKKDLDLFAFKFFAKEKPKKKGFYMVLKGVRHPLRTWLETSYTIAKWNGKVWDIDDESVVISWRYSTPQEIKEFRGI